jgi:hypothetical protein
MDLITPEFDRVASDKVWKELEALRATNKQKVYAPVEEAPAFSFLGTTLHHHPSGREWTFTDEEIADVRHYIAAHTDSTLDTGVLFEDAVHRFGSTE